MSLQSRIKALELSSANIMKKNALSPKEALYIKSKIGKSTGHKIFAAIRAKKEVDAARKARKFIS